MPHAEFLRLLQLVDANRKAVGRESMEIADADVETAQEIDDRAVAHPATEDQSAHNVIDCPECQSIKTDRAMLREKLFSQGQNFPMEVWQEL